MMRKRRNNKKKNVKFLLSVIGSLSLGAGCFVSLKFDSLLLSLYLATIGAVLLFPIMKKGYDADKLGSNKFREYKFIEIPKDVYTKYKDAQPSKTSYKCFHDINKCKGLHKHVDGKAIYSIPASTFTDKNNLTPDGNFYWVDNNSANKIGISATIAAGRSIFWKETEARRTIN